MADDIAQKIAERIEDEIHISYDLIPTSAVAAIIREELAKVLPVTKDGVLIRDGMRLFYIDQFDNVLPTGPVGTRSEVAVHAQYRLAPIYVHPTHCFSTLDAALFSTPAAAPLKGKP